MEETAQIAFVAAVQNLVVVVVAAACDLVLHSRYQIRETVALEVAVVDTEQGLQSYQNQETPVVARQVDFRNWQSRAVVLVAAVVAMDLGNWHSLVAEEKAGFQSPQRLAVAAPAAVADCQSWQSLIVGAVAAVTQTVAVAIVAGSATIRNLREMPVRSVADCC